MFSVVFNCDCVSGVVFVEVIDWHVLGSSWRACRIRLKLQHSRPLASSRRRRRSELR